jgi:hypothetical protein
MTFTSSPIPRPAGPPASATPLRDFLAGVRNGVDPGYIVVPRSLAESMPLLWQQQLVHLIAELQHAYGHLPWPIYQVVPSRPELLVDLDEEQLAEVGCMVEIDSDGELCYRDRQGRLIEHPERHQVLVSCMDPIPRARAGQLPTSAAQPKQQPPQQSRPQPQQPKSTPVWPTE